MRVISGIYKGRKLIGDDIIGTRPTMDRVKESLFAMIQNKIKGSVCLDLFAGSGSLGLEALSNGAKYCYFVDQSKNAIQAMEANLKNVPGEQYQILKKEAQEVLKQFAGQSLQFDLIFLDPPYDKSLIAPCLKRIEDLSLLSIGGQVICEYEIEEFTGSFSVKAEKSYGSKKIRIYERTE